MVAASTDRVNGSQRVHGDWGVTLSCRSTNPQLSIIVFTPTHSRTVIEHRAGVGVTSADGFNGLQSCYSTGSGSVRASVPKLSIRIRSPTHSGTVIEHRAGVIATSADGFYRLQSRNGPGSGVVGSRERASISKLPIII